MSSPSETTITPTSTTPTTPTTPAHRIYVGNLSQNVESSVLETAFAEFGKVLSVRVTKKINSTFTFGFVDMEDLETAQKAVAAINGREFDGKAVKVELAHERTTTKPKRVSRKPRTSRKSTAASTTATTTTAGENATESTESSPAVTGRPHRRRTNRRGNKQQDSTAAATTTTNTDATTATTTTSAPAKTNTRQKREKKPVSTTSTTPAAERQQSTTTLFVRNLPYSFDDAKLLEAFKDCSPKSAHVIVNKLTNKSKGFGFVEFDDVANQQKGLALNKLNVESRELSVKIALVPNFDTTGTTATTPDTTSATA